MAMKKFNENNLREERIDNQTVIYSKNRVVMVDGRVVSDLSREERRELGRYVGYVLSIGNGGLLC